MNIALSTLPHPVSSTHVQLVAETILRTPGRRTGPKGFRADGTSGTSDFVPTLVSSRIALTLRFDDQGAGRFRNNF